MSSFDVLIAQMAATLLAGEYAGGKAGDGDRVDAQQRDADAAVSQARAIYRAVLEQGK